MSRRPKSLLERHRMAVSCVLASAAIGASVATLQYVRAGRGSAGPLAALDLYPERISLAYRPLMTPVDLRQATQIPDLLMVARIEHAESERERLAKDRAAEKLKREMAAAAELEEQKKQSEAKLESERDLQKQAQLRDAAAQQEKVKEAQEQNRKMKQQILEQRQSSLLAQMEQLKGRTADLRAQRLRAFTEFQGYAAIAQHYVNFPNFAGQVFPEVSVMGPDVNQVIPSIRLSEASPEYRDLVGNLSRTWQLVAGLDAQINAADSEMRQLYQQIDRLRREVANLQ